MEYSFFIYLKESRADILLFLSIAKKKIFVTCNIYLFIHIYQLMKETNLGKNVKEKIL